jgi:hypothetical protein
VPRDIEDFRAFDLVFRIIELGLRGLADGNHVYFLAAPRSSGSMAEVETFAHLEHLRATRALQRHEEAGTLLYHL